VYLHLDHHSGEPIYRQIVEQVKYRAASGQLAAGDQLPSIRALASELKINPRTVVKAYDELRHAGLVVKKQGQGVFVAGQREGTSRRLRRAALSEMSRRLLAEAIRMGADYDEIMQVIEAEAERMGVIEHEYASY